MASNSGLMNTADAIEPLPFSSNDSDSGYDEQSLSSASIASSIYDYEQENGRTYHAYKAGKYALPNDEGEQERMDLCYHSLRLTLNNRHFLAPIAQPTSILDVGTGTGIWAMDVADDYPEAHVLGTDLSPIQPGLVPPNLEFQVADAEEDWDMPGRFDLVHTRYMNGFSIRSWRQFYEQAFASMKPGGWVENQEFDLHWTSDDGSMPADGAFEKWQRLWEQGVESVGMTARCYPEVMRRQMEEAGFINVKIVPFKMPLGPWPKSKRLREAGLYLYSSMYDGLSGLSLRVFTQMLGWSVEELEVLLALVRAEWKRKAMHVYVPIYVVYGQKPPTAPSFRQSIHITELASSLEIDKGQNELHTFTTVDWQQAVRACKRFSLASTMPLLQSKQLNITPKPVLSHVPNDHDFYSIFPGPRPYLAPKVYSVL